MGRFLLWPMGAGKCLKQHVKATVVSANGDHYIAYNAIRHVPRECPRKDMKTGEGYHLCRQVCRQYGHAEANACVFAGRAAAGGILYLEGHDYACESCIKICDAHGIQAIVIGPPPECPA
ncbi:MAG TPA: hypothetical protein DFI00_02565 [Rhodospirillaceae bacterium]|nr:hypothetical protein [Rhodospirillaceae bacterium]|tara:strand:- start:663 stop:1022 length:360 start_codon:yes stop_codon:yes gene_type:complete